jgi:O-antigen/teichoic acid export membrane protein
LAKSDFGAFAFGVTMLALATNLTTFGLPKSLSRFMPIYQERGEPEKVAGLLILVCGLVVTMSVVSIAIVYGLSLTSAVQATVDTTSLSLLLILILLTPIDAIDRVLEAVFSVAGQVRAIFIRRHLIGPAL